MRIVRGSCLCSSDTVGRAPFNSTFLLGPGDIVRLRSGVSYRTCSPLLMRRRNILRCLQSRFDRHVAQDHAFHAAFQGYAGCNFVEP
jgi:hypothetical protein